MLKYELITARLDQIRRSANRLRRLAQLPKNEFAADPDNFAIAEHHLRRALEALLDIGRHIIAKKGLGRPEEYRAVIVILGQNGILPKEYADKIKGMAGYRNRLVHGYAEIDVEEIYEIINSRLDDFEEFCRHITEYLAKEKSK